MNEKKEDVGVLLDYTLDLAFGSNENNFECKITQEKHCCEAGFYLYFEGTEYGGIIDGIGVDTDEGDVIYSGRTWHGILETKILEPDAGADYLILNGEANTVLGSLVSRMGLSDLFKASTEDSGINISKYKMNRYVDGYAGIKKMLKTAGAKLYMSFKNGFAELSAKPVVDYSKDEQFDSDQFSFKIEKHKHHINHVVCLGKGELSEREVIHVYADENGNISETQVFSGISEVMAVYENTNAQDSAELKQGGIDVIKESWNSDVLDFDFDSDDESYGIGDIVGAFEHNTGTEVKTEIAKKIVKIANGTITISYTPEEKGSSGGSSTSSGSSGSGGGCSCIVVNVVQEDNENAVQSGAVYSHVEEKVGNIEVLLGTI